MSRVHVVSCGVVRVRWLCVPSRVEVHAAPGETEGTGERRGVCSQHQRERVRESDM